MELNKESKPDLEKSKKDVANGESLSASNLTNKVQEEQKPLDVQERILIELKKVKNRFTVFAIFSLAILGWMLVRIIRFL